MKKQKLYDEQDSRVNKVDESILQAREVHSMRMEILRLEKEKAAFLLESAKAEAKLNELRLKDYELRK